MSTGYRAIQVLHLINCFAKLLLKHEKNAYIFLSRATQQEVYLIHVKK